MRLTSIRFTEQQGTPQEWELGEVSLGAKNLIVGKNASGKSRTLSVIGALAANLTGSRPVVGAGTYDCRFVSENSELLYHLSFSGGQVLSEKLTRNGEVLLDRVEGGEGNIFAAAMDGGKFVRFQAPTSSLAAVVRRDSLQHPFLEPLFEWGAALRCYYFGSSLGKDHFAVIVQNAPRVDDRDGNAVVGVFRAAEREFGETFLNIIKEDLGRLDYLVDQVGCAAPVSLRVNQDLPGEFVGLYVKEHGLPGITDQYTMSQGMFRVLSLLIHVNYFRLKNSATCVLVDDVGEGLDFDRSCKLIALLRSKADEAGVQLIMSSNDRFVMNAVPLEEWSVLQRVGNKVSVRNIENSKDIFEEFKFTGLSNFSFLEMDVLGTSGLE